MNTRSDKKGNNILLSVCIPTYNRKKELLEVVNSVLSIKRDDINVVVTDNCSTDGTREELEKIKDSRLKYYKNKEPIPALSNMIEAIFNGDGDYIFYCNDRDIILFPEFFSLINLIEKEEFAFLHTMQRRRAKDIIGKFDRRVCNSGKVFVYKSGFDSLMNQECTHHPTGMVFNGKIIRKYLKKEAYFRYLKDVYEYSFLMRDVLMYGGGKSARFDCGCWDERPAVFVMKNKSGSVVNKVLYFYPKMRYLLAKDTLEHTLKINDYGMSDEEKIKVGIQILCYFYESLIGYKYGMSSLRETMHYGIKRRFVGTPEMIKIFHKYFYSSLNYLEEHEYPKELCREWEKLYAPLFRRMIYLSCKADLGVIRWSWVTKKELAEQRKTLQERR